MPTKRAIKPERELRAEEQKAEVDAPILRKIGQATGKTEIELAEMSAKLDAANTQITRQVHNRIAQDVADAQSLDPSQSRAELLQGNSEQLVQLREQAIQVREESISGQSRSDRWTPRRKCIALCVGVGTLGVAIGGLIIQRRSSSSDDQPPEVKDALDEFERAVEAWQRTETGERLWTRFADYCERWNPSLATQLLMVDTVKRISPLPNPTFEWTASAKLAAIDAIVEAYDNATVDTVKYSSSALYQAIVHPFDRGGSLGSSVLPLYIAADVLELALTRIMAKAQNDPKPGPP